MNRFFVNEMSGNPNEQTDAAQSSSSEEQSESTSRVQNNVQEESSSPVLENLSRPVSNDPLRTTGDPPTVVSSAPNTTPNILHPTVVSPAPDTLAPSLLLDATRQRLTMPSVNLLNSNDEFAVNVLTQLSIEQREQRESAVGRNASVVTLTASRIREEEDRIREEEARIREEEARIRNGEGLAMLAEAAIRHRRGVASDPITPNRGRRTLGNMRNRFPKTRLNSVGDEPYSDGEND